jgi:DNA-binding MarR family transcriptional regulator
MPRLEEEIKQATFKHIYQKAFINLMFTSSWVQTQLNQLFKHHELTGPQFNILRILRGQHPKPATVNLLIDRMLDKTSNASRIVDKLVAKGLVTRQTCAQDRRTVDVLITGAGLAVLQRIDQEEHDIHPGLTNLTEQEAAELSRLLDKIRDKDLG